MAGRYEVERDVTAEQQMGGWRICIHFTYIFQENKTCQFSPPRLTRVWPIRDITPVRVFFHSACLSAGSKLNWIGLCWGGGCFKCWVQKYIFHGEKHANTIVCTNTFWSCYRWRIIRGCFLGRNPSILLFSAAGRWKKPLENLRARGNKLWTMERHRLE